MKDFDVIFSENSGTDIQLDRCGLCSNGKNVYLNEYSRYYSIICVIKGELDVSLNEREIRLKENNVYIVSPSVTFSVLSAKNRPAYYFFAFDGNIPRKYCKKQNLEEERELSEEEKILLDKLSDCPEDSFSFEMKVLSFVFIALKNCGEHLKKDKEILFDYKNRFVNSFISAVMKNYTDSKLSVSSLCADMGVSVSYFTNTFTKTVNVSPKQFIIDYRIEKAKEILLNTNLSVSEASYHVGYEDSFTFSRAFKKKEGVSPTAFVRQQKQIVYGF